MVQRKAIIALWPAFPQACFHPHPSTEGQMETWIRSRTCCQLYPWREGLLREGHLSLIPAPWDLWNKLRRFLNHLGACTYELQLSLKQSCYFSCWPHAQSTADSGDRMVILWHRSIFLGTSGLAPLSFYAGQTGQSFLEKSKSAVLLSHRDPTVFRVQTAGIWS